MLPDKAIKEFQKLYLNELNTRITFKEAKHLAEEFIELFDLISTRSIKSVTEK